jgi:superfamily II DNA helicase RecQ
MNNSPASSHAKRLIRRCEASSATPRPESRIIIGDLRSCVECAPTSRCLSAMTLDQLGAKMRCDKCGKRPERYYPANQSDTPGFVRSF